MVTIGADRSVGVKPEGCVACGGKAANCCRGAVFCPAGKFGENRFACVKTAPPPLGSMSDRDDGVGGAARGMGGMTGGDGREASGGTAAARRAPGKAALGGGTRTGTGSTRIG